MSAFYVCDYIKREVFVLDGRYVAVEWSESHDAPGRLYHKSVWCDTVPLDVLRQVVLDVGVLRPFMKYDDEVAGRSPDARVLSADWCRWVDGLQSDTVATLLTAPVHDPDCKCGGRE